MGPQGELFSSKRFMDLISSSSHLDSEGLADSILEALFEWTCSGGSFDDDVTLVVLDIRQADALFSNTQERIRFITSPEGIQDDCYISSRFMNVEEKTSFIITAPCPLRASSW